MAENKLVPISIENTDGVILALQGRGFRASFRHDDGAYDTPSLAAVQATRTGSFPSYVRSQPTGKVFPLHVTIKSRDSRGMFDLVTNRFDPKFGLQILRAQDDCDGILKRVDVVAQQAVHEQRSPRAVTLPLYSPAPYWESDAVVSEATAIGQQAPTPGDGVFAAPYNAGSAEAFPTFSIQPATQKFATGGWTYLREITYCNRSEFPLTGPASGKWLIDVTDGGWDTAAIIDVSAITTSCSTTVSIGQAMPFDVTVASTAAFDQEGFLLADPGGGSEEQFEYEIKNGTEFTLLRRNLHHDLPETHTASFTIHQSRMNQDGDDIAVFIDSVQVPSSRVEIADVDTASTKVWVEIADGPAVSAILNQTVLFGGTVLQFQDVHPFVVGDYLVAKRSDGPLFESILVTAKTDRTVTVLRGQRGSASGVGFNAATVFYRSGHHIQLAWNNTKATEGAALSRSTNPERFLIDLSTSDNDSWNWSMSNFPLWADATRQSGGWRRIIYPGRPDIPELIRNRLSAKTTLDYDVAGDEARFVDQDPTGASPNFDALEFVSPLGIDDVAGGLRLAF